MNIRRSMYFNGDAAVYEFRCKQNKHDLYLFVKQMKLQLRRTIRRLLKRGPIRWSMNTECILKKISKNDEDAEKINAHFRTKTVITTEKRQIGQQLREGFTKMIKSMEEFLKQGSGWIFEKCIKVEMKIVRFEPINPAQYIPLPTALKNKRSILNIRNTDNKCFVYCILAALHPLDRMQNANRTNKYIEFENELNLSGLKFP